MTTIGICTSVYEAGRRYVPSYAKAAIAAATKAPDTKVIFLFAIDDVQDPTEFLAPLSGFQTQHAFAGRGRSVTAVRNVLFDLGRQSRVDHLVFVDLDDLLLPDALMLHSQALSQTDISFGDLELMDASGKPSGRSMFGARHFPDVISDSDILLHRNFMGLSNTAIRREKMRASEARVPEHLVSTDWWLFTNLLDHGLTASRTAGPVVGYRQHDGNVLGGGGAMTLSDLRRRCSIACEHFDALPPTPARRGARATAAHLQSWLESVPVDKAEAVMRDRMPPPGLWFEEIFALGSAIGEAAN